MVREALPTHLQLAVGPVPLHVTHNRRARRLGLRICMATRAVQLTLPPRQSLARVQRFLADNRGWLEAQAAQRLLPPVPFVPGACLPVAGASLRLQCGSGRVVQQQGGALLVPGAGAVYDARVRRWLKQQAQARLAAESRAVAGRIGRQPADVRVGDFRSRWGSCSADGRIAYSWRLILAPEFVRQSVVAHEVAHLAEMNHSPRFWALATELLGTSHAPARQWLRRHAAELMRYGARDQAAESRALATAACNAS